MIKANNTTHTELENVVVDGKLMLATSNRQPAWAAEIVGTHPIYKLNRKFIDADDKGPGWKAWDLEEGKIYCIFEYSQHFVKVENETLVELTKKEVEEIVK
ncbi:TPA: hypothetical protein SVB51_001866 [Streptococcus equi subsp. equi]|uniref:hypothetical protein n=1 Tax=Streptococcus equi TaxID=1336 RepID=UPI00065A6674|nr:hypothetical protein [Streptococcus equi]CRR08301.1 Uncharacterised protein [Streptococcus equi subsp. equi]CRT23314.1 Uncharacterised protein [Streptococcus equi subsp. equi]CRT24388.1 Uncharacterised protein [Streptococcus equi subsp. equi]CRT50447.1 Uncharacterised protein [Streptococcus equi subsp. equi]HEK9271082.1 hypothetical protein [Streptococcus equi subsp. equi]